MTSSMMDEPIEVLGLTVRANNCLRRGGQVRTVGQLQAAPDWQLLSIRNLGVGSLADIKRKLAAYEARCAEVSAAPPVALEPDTSPDEQPYATDRPVHLSNDTPLDALGLSVRAHNALVHHGVRTVQQLARMSEDDIRAVRNIGIKSVAEILAVLSNLPPFPEPDQDASDPPDPAPAA